MNKLKTLQCPKCTFASTHQSTLDDHLLQAHPDVSVLPTVNPSYGYQCELCPFIAKLQINLKRHLATTHPKLRCDKCKFASSSEFSLFLHHENEHKNEKEPVHLPTFTCDLCGMTFSQAQDLDSHIQRRHSHYEAPSAPPQAPSNNHGLSLILEEQIDMSQTLKSFKESIQAQLS